eukprot:Hpha_TRINITY_DN13676_c0_g1::TRINITY_DN13676_c0_g1_i4::g.122905::m.122905
MHKHTWAMPPRPMLRRVAAFLVLAAAATAVSDCTASSNTDTNSAKECKYLKPCTKADVPAEPAGYKIECTTDPCPADQDIMFDRIDGTDIGVLFESDCENTVEKCKDACEQKDGCCGFNFQFNPGQYATATLGRCVAKACDGKIGTSRYGMVYYQRLAGAVGGGSNPPPPPPSGGNVPAPSGPSADCTASGNTDTNSA